MKYTTQNGWTRKRMLRQIFAYNDGKRAVRESDIMACVYEGVRGNRCAVGAFLPATGECLEHSGSVHSLLDQYPELLVSMPLGAAGLEQMQGVHDNCDDVVDDTREALADWILAHVEDSP